MPALSVTGGSAMRADDLAPYVEAGYDLIPLRGQTKVPRDPGWRSRPYEDGHVEEHAAKGRNIGVRLQPGQVVIDYDPRNDPDKRGKAALARYGVELEHSCLSD